LKKLSDADEILVPRRDEGRRGGKKESQMKSHEPVGSLGGCELVERPYLRLSSPTESIFGKLPPQHVSCKGGSDNLEPLYDHPDQREINGAGQGRIAILQGGKVAIWDPVPQRQGEKGKEATQNSVTVVETLGRQNHKRRLHFSHLSEGGISGRAFSAVSTKAKPGRDRGVTR